MEYLQDLHKYPLYFIMVPCSGQVSRLKHCEPNYLGLYFQIFTTQTSFIHEILSPISGYLQSVETTQGFNVVNMVDQKRTSAPTYKRRTSLVFDNKIQMQVECMVNELIGDTYSKLAVNVNDVVNAGDRIGYFNRVSAISLYIPISLLKADKMLLEDHTDVKTREILYFCAI